jgi:formiminoglutamase
MDLKLYFDALSEQDLPSDLPEDSLFKFIYANEHELPDTDGLDIAIIAVDDVRGNSSLKAGGAQQIRQKLYQLKKGNSACNIADLGNLRSGMNLDETHKRLSVALAILIAENILPIIIGGGHDMDLGQYMAYENEEKLVSILNVDSRLDLGDSEGTEPTDSHIHKLFVHEPNYLFSYNQLAYQGYLVNPNALKVLEQLNFQAIRLGEVRDSIQKVEPIIREADMLTFDVSAIQSQYCPGGSKSEVFGLTGEEACQIAWYAGMSDKLSSAGFYEYNPEKDDTNKSSAMTIAVMIWYFIEGYKNRKNEKGFQTNDFLKYVVALDADPETISFYKSRLSEKWWMEVPNTAAKGLYDRNHIIPCDFADYEFATKGEIPERWITAFSKMT